MVSRSPAANRGFRIVGPPGAVVVLDLFIVLGDVGGQHGGDPFAVTHQVYELAVTDGVDEVRKAAASLGDQRDTAS